MSNDLQFKISVSRTFKNKDGRKQENRYVHNKGFKNETHTLESLYYLLVVDGYSFSAHLTDDSGPPEIAIKRGCKTQRCKENFASMQVIPLDDDSELPNVLETWRNDYFYQGYGAFLHESASSIAGIKEKCRVVFILDKPIHDPLLLEEIRVAMKEHFTNKYPAHKIDELKSRSTVFYGASGKRSELNHKVLPFDILETEILAPYRATKAKQEAAMNKQVHAAKKSSSDVDLSKYANILRNHVTRRLDGIFSNLAAKQKGDNRHSHIYAAGRQIGAMMGGWAESFTDLFGDLEDRVSQATVSNGYQSDHNANGFIPLKNGIDKGLLEPQSLEAHLDSYYKEYPDKNPFTQANQTTSETGSPLPSIVETYEIPQDDYSNLAPPLPDELTPKIPKQLTKSMQWVKDFCQHVKYWSPRSHSFYRSTLAFWVLSSVNLNRSRIMFGPNGLSLMLYLVLVGKSTTSAKSTTAGIATKIINNLGLDYSQLPDFITPEKFINHLSTPTKLQDWPETMKEENTLLLQGRRSWYYDEFGQHIDGMMRDNSQMGQFKRLLLTFFDGKPEYKSEKLIRGETVYQPYLSLLAATTPGDIKRNAKSGSVFWSNGLFARMNFASPEKDFRGQGRFPKNEEYHTPNNVLQPLHAWNKKLGSLGELDINPIDYGEEGPPKKDSPMYTLNVNQGPKEHLKISDSVQDSLESYEDGLSEISMTLGDDYDASYGRLPQAALKVAGLLCSFDGETTISQAHFDFALYITEQWRESLHRVHTSVNETVLSETKTFEDKILALLEKADSPVTIRDIYRKFKRTAKEVTAVVETMSKAGLVKIETIQAKNNKIVKAITLS